MSSPEKVPFLNILTHPLAKVLDFAFGCRHRKLSRVFTIGNDSYRVCCDCGATLNYSWETMSIQHPGKLRRPAAAADTDR
jgi:hypothetical protein